jgi:hypothetical protein
MMSLNDPDPHGKRTVQLTGRCVIRLSKPSGERFNIHGGFLTTKGVLGLAGEDLQTSQDPVIVEFWTPGRPSSTR